MADRVRITRSRASLCGIALILLGGWGGVAPFAGPSFGFGYTPDHAWTSTAGRLYLSALPGAVVVLAGLIVTLTRSRWFGGFCAFIAALGGAWFIGGAALVRLLPASVAGRVTTGTPIASSPSAQILTGLALFAGAGALIVFFAALALGRFSIVAYRDYARSATDAGEDIASGAAAATAYGAYPAASAQPSFRAVQPQYPSTFPSGHDMFPPEQYPSTTEQYPSTPEQYPSTPEQYPSTTEQYPAGGQYPSAAGQYPPHDPFGLTQDAPAPGPYPRSGSPFPPAQYPGYQQPATPESTTALEQPGQDPQ